MPYLRISCPALDAAQRRHMAEELTAAITDLFYNPRTQLSREELRERTTVHFFPYAEGEIFIGAAHASDARPHRHHGGVV